MDIKNILAIFLIFVGIALLFAFSIEEDTHDIKQPYAMLASTQTQNITVPNVPKPIYFNTLEDSYKINLHSDLSNITIVEEGDYFVTLSAIFQTGTANRHVEIWARKNNIDIPRTNTRQEFTNTNTEQVLSVPFIFDLKKNDRLSFMWTSEGSTMQMVYTGNTTYSPATPSIILTMNKISAITK